MKKYILTTLCLLVAIVAAAQTISTQRARHLATQFVQQRLNTLATTTTQPVYVVNGTQDEAADVYVFNVRNSLTAHDGFVLVAAEEDLDDPILGYSDDGAFDLQNAPANFRWWMQQYAQQIEYWRSHKTESGQGKTVNGPAFSTPGKVTVPPLLGDLRWNQTVPYFNMTPVDDGEHCMTGCGATAIAMIMHYYKWPLQGTGKRTDAKRTTETVDFSQSYYDWANMLPIYGKSSSYTEAQANAVAKLMYDCGVASDMSYGVEGSGTTDPACQKALINYFRYKSGIKLSSVSGLRTSLDTTLKGELDAGRPIKFSGWEDAAGNGGHTWVCDGYDDNGYYHMNWGWGGMENGYFKTTACSVQGSSLNSSQTIMYNIIPDRTATTVDGITYNLLNSEQAEVARCASGTYSGEVTIPASITVDDVTYKVTRIQANAFVGCGSLTAVSIPSSITYISGGAFADCGSLATITVPWNTPLSNVKPLAFGNDILNATTLVVPKGKIKNYASNNTWGRFTNIADTEGTTTQWTAWEPYEKGTGTYTFQNNVTRNAGDQQTNIPVYYRTQVDDANQMQLWLQSWCNDVDLFVCVDRSTGKCTVAKQSIGYSQSSATANYDMGEFYVSDYPTYNASYTYAKYPCTLDEQSGLLSMRLYYFVSAGGWSGSVAETFQIDPLSDCRITIGDLPSATTASEGTGQQVINIERGDQATFYKYVLVQRELHDSEISAYAADIISGSIDATISTAKQLKLALPEEGIYTFIAVSYDSSYKGQKYAATTFRFYNEANWTSLGKCKYTDDALTTTMSTKLSAAGPYLVEIFQNDYNPGLYRLKAPYGSTYPYAKNGTYTNQTVYIDIHAEDPEGVYIRYQTTGKDLQKKGTAYIYTKAAQMLDEGQTLDQVKAAGVCGTFTGRTFTFPAGAILIDKYGTSEYTEANLSGQWLIDLSELPAGIASLSTVNGQRPTATYNLAGQPVDATYRGIVIQDGKKIFRR